MYTNRAQAHRFAAKTFPDNFEVKSNDHETKNGILFFENKMLDKSKVLSIELVLANCYLGFSQIPPKQLKTS